jgi:hypothetical protein
MATRRQRERKARQRAWHNEIDHSSTGLPLIGVWFDEVNAFVPEPYSFGPVPGPGYDLGTPSWVECPFCGVAFDHDQAACDEKMANWRPTGFLSL